VPSLVDVSAAHDAGVTVTLDRPEKKNALSIALRDELSDSKAVRRAAVVGGPTLDL
jgi:enoyl-CoA hydratase/carnithine racemase